jgi:hypothetical protein
LSTADDAIKISITRHTRVAECLARIVRAQTLLVSEEIELVEEELRRVRTLIEETGAAIYEPSSRIWRTTWQALGRHMVFKLPTGRAPADAEEWARPMGGS